MRILRILLWTAVAVALFFFGAATAGFVDLRNPLGLQANAPSAGGSAVTPGAPLGGAFALVDNKGRPATEALLRDKPSAVFFGFTHCPDVCPTTLSDVSTWIEALGADAERMRFIFVTVDPERDTPQVMDAYVSAFSPRIVGVTGNPEKVHAMVKDYKIVSRKVPTANGDYTMDHTASVLLLDSGGGLVGTIARDESRDAALAKLRRLVAA